jgi:Domain of unknown function (DUF4286)
MVIYNVTSQVLWPVHQQWLQWLQQVHIPEVMATGCFERFQLVRLLETDEEEGPIYAVQYYAASQAAYQTYIDQYAPALRQQAFDQWGNQFIAFRSLMQVIA